ncbi:MAG: dihydroneopterin aldolase family protein [Halobacteriales archaeon]
MEPTDRDVACFEAGIKLGTLYHQFIGTPVAPETADGLARAMAAAVERQPHCVSAAVDLDVEAIATDANRFGYTGLRGHHVSATVTVAVGDVRVDAGIGLEDDYPMMRVVDIEA